MMWRSMERRYRDTLRIFLLCLSITHLLLFVCDFLFDSYYGGFYARVIFLLCICLLLIPVCVYARTLASNLVSFSSVYQVIPRVLFHLACLFSVAGF